MQYYIVDGNTGKIIGVVDKMNSDFIQELADDFNTNVYAIEGQHSGYSARNSPLSSGQCEWCNLPSPQGFPIVINGVHVHHVYNKDTGNYERKTCQKTWRKYRT